MDPTFQERILLVDLDKELDAVQEQDEIPPKLRVLREDILLHVDWDPLQAGKVFPPVEALCQWLAAAANYYSKKKVKKG
jgi:hypothetical protein